LYSVLTWLLVELESKSDCRKSRVSFRREKGFIVYCLVWAKVLSNKIRPHGLMAKALDFG
jgi:hypothetical protein